MPSPPHQRRHQNPRSLARPGSRLLSRAEISVQILKKREANHSCRLSPQDSRAKPGAQKSRGAERLDFLQREPAFRPDEEQRGTRRRDFSQDLPEAASFPLPETDRAANLKGSGAKISQRHRSLDGWDLPAAGLFRCLLCDPLPASCSLPPTAGGPADHDPFSEKGNDPFHPQLCCLLDHPLHLVSLGDALGEGERERRFLRGASLGQDDSAGDLGRDQFQSDGVLGPYPVYSLDRVARGQAEHAREMMSLLLIKHHALVSDVSWPNVR